ncbi:MAG: hypothetical protein AAGF53_00740 [Pseudomonadota bacterium]
MAIDRPPHSDVSEHDLEHATEVAAELVRRFGNAYWPFFERLERELGERRDRANRLVRFTKERSNR